MKRKGVKLIMSEYADIVIGNLSLHWFRNYLDSKIVSLFFSKNDLIVVNNCNIDDDDKDAGTYTKYMYRTTVRRAKERLDAQGFGLNNFEKIFNDEMVQAVDYSSFLYHLQGDYDEEDKNNEIRIKKNVSLKKWKNAMKNLFIFGIMVPVSTALIPLFQIYKNMGLINTRACLILTYIAFGLPLSVFLITGYMRTLSDEILEASVIDGCGIFNMMRYIVTPLMKNGIVTVLVLQFFYKWNDLIFSMTLVSDTKLKTIQTGLMYFENEFGQKNWGGIFAAVTMSVLPMLILYMFLNKKIIEGMTSGAVKG